MSRPALMIVHRMLAPLSPFLETQYDVYRLWEGPPPEAATQIEALVIAGEPPLDKALVEKLPNLSLIACFTAGYDGVDVEWCKARGLKLSHAPNVNHEDVADLAIGLMLASRRQIISGQQRLLNGEWVEDARVITGSIQKERIGIVGLGAIGQAIARRAEAFNMDVSWWGPRPKDAPWPRADSLIKLANDADVLVVACRATPDNRHIIDDTVIRAVGAHGLLVNVARGSLVDEEALIAALRSGALGSAALDVFAHEPTDPERWKDVPNVVLTPHTAGATTHAVQGMMLNVMQNLAAHFAGSPLLTPIED
ncbi:MULTISPECIES: 2-hydroxyacid dehydrogenase [unclassified Brevundimonas]|uniref:2-hydroxyacid dehydrogenase n=1 Tax=unclassified Brevundimonas TaxID=2622653 RepID=UPI0025B7E44C|nr:MULTISPECIES: 2-hydroxyacid dehydrogenase [unclassified Brevundimonas]